MKARRTKQGRQAAAAPARDWRTGSGYSSLATSASEFAWQFLRRNSDYRAVWQSFVAEHGLPSMDDGGPAAVAPLSARAAERWGLSFLIDPACESFDGLRLLWLRRSASVSYTSWHEGMMPQGMTPRGPWEVIVRVNLRTPQAPLLAALGGFIGAMRRAKGLDAQETRRRPREWITYLRILDADEAGAKPREICAALWPTLPNAYPERAADKQLNKARRAARKLRDGGYITLPLLGEARRK